MTDLQNLLDQIDRLDQQSSEAPWKQDRVDYPTGDVYVEADSERTQRKMDRIDPDIGCAYVTDAEFIALARTFAPAAAKALRTILTECESFEIAHDDEDNPFHQGVRWTVMAIRQAITDAMEAQ